MERKGIFDLKMTHDVEYKSRIHRNKSEKNRAYGRDEEKNNWYS